MYCFKLVPKKAITLHVVRFFVFLCLSFFSLLVKSASISPEEESGYLLSLTPYTENISFKESELQEIYNTEKGHLTGIKAKFSYYINDWKLSIYGDQSHGTLQYFGQTQLGQKLSTTTNIDNNLYGLSLDKEFWNFTRNACRFCGSLSAFLALNYESIDRDIMSQANVNGLTEEYRFSLAELGVIWEVENLLFVDWQLSLSHGQAMNAQLEVDFSSSYDKTTIPLNNVYVNQVELAITYTLVPLIDIGLLLNYSKSFIEKSEKFPLFTNGIQIGRFYQPQRSMYSTRIGLQLTSHF